MEEIKLSDIDVAALLIRRLFEEKMINERTAQKALEKLKELSSRKNAA
jgi:predicted nucleotidyltransferase